MSERRQAAWDEAQRRYPTRDRQAGFASGAAWADANPKPDARQPLPEGGETMTDNLRDRIAAAIARGYEADHPEPNRHDYRAADEVLAEFGLTIEKFDTEESVSVRRFGRREWIDHNVTFHRVVGKWER